MALAADRHGASLVEYIILLGTIALIAIVGYRALGRSVMSTESAIAGCVDALQPGCTRGGSGAVSLSTAGTNVASGSSASTRAEQSGAAYWTKGILRGAAVQAWDDVKGLATLAAAATPPGMIYYAATRQPNPAGQAALALGKLALWSSPPMQLVTALGGPDPVGDTVRQAARSVRDSWKRDRAETLGRGIFEVATIVVPLAKARAAGEIADVARAAERAGQETRALEEAANGARLAGKGAVASRYFTAEELAAAHPTPVGKAIYHGLEHTQEVADTAEKLALARGLPEDQARFIGQVGAVHDWDPARVAGTPARVKATLQALEDDFNGVKPLAGDGGSVLRDRFGWDQSKLRQAEAMIQRTEFPFDAPHPAYPGTTPAAEYQRMVAQLPPAQQDFVLREGAVLSEYADKGSGYMVGTTSQVYQRVEGLSNEIAAVTGKTIDMKPGTAGFIDSIGAPGAFSADERIAGELGRPAPSIPSRNDVLGVMPESYGQNFYSNLNEFKKYQAPPPPPPPAPAPPHT